MKTNPCVSLAKAVVPLVACVLTVGLSEAAIPWSKQFDPDLTLMQDPTIKQLFSDAAGYKLIGVSYLPGIFSTGQSTAIGARFGATGALEWGAFLDGGFGFSSHERVVPMDDTTGLFASYASAGKARIGVYDAAALTKRFAYEFDLRPTTEFSPQVTIEWYPGDVIGVAQHMGSGNSINVMLFDAAGNRISDKDYSGIVDPASRSALVRLLRLPDLSGFLLISYYNVVCLNNDGTVRWAKTGPGSDQPVSIAQDGSIVFTSVVPRTGQFPDGGTFLIKLNADGTLAWVRIIDGLAAVTDNFILGRNAVYDGENVWLVGGTIAAPDASSVALDGSLLGLLRIDGATGDIIAQADLAFEDRNVFIGEFSAWTGTHAIFAIESTDPLIGSRGHVLRTDGALENPELIALSGAPVETTRISHDPEMGSLLYTWSAFNGSVISAVSLDAETLTPARDCDLFAPVPFLYGAGSYVSETPSPAPVVGDAAITVTDHDTALVSVDLPVVTMALNEFELCQGVSEPPASPVLSVALSDVENTLDLTFPTETGVTYQILSGPELAGGLAAIDSVVGTGAVVVYPISLEVNSIGFYQVSATRSQ